MVHGRRSRRDRPGPAGPPGAADPVGPSPVFQPSSLLLSSASSLHRRQQHHRGSERSGPDAVAAAKPQEEDFVRRASMQRHVRPKDPDPAGENLRGLLQLVQGCRGARILQVKGHSQQLRATP